jgi:hypothetical protein
LRVATAEGRLDFVESSDSATGTDETKVLQMKKSIAGGFDPVERRQLV